jgi:uncharacterized protein (DUF433 family)
MPPLPHPLILVTPDVHSGAPVFNGTRVPVKALFDYLKGGEPLTEFLDEFPDVSREHSIAVLELSQALAVQAATTQSPRFGALERAAV